MSIMHFIYLAIIGVIAALYALWQGEKQRRMSAEESVQHAKYQSQIVELKRRQAANVVKIQEDQNDLKASEADFNKFTTDPTDSGPSAS